MKSIEPKKIAVCLYGQIRTGDYCKPFIREFLKIENHEIDFFCSTKNYNTYLRLNDNAEIELTSEDIDSFISYYDPKMQNVITKADEDPFKYDIITGRDTSLFYSSFIDSIMLKQKYELLHNFMYDYVITLRYDTIYEDINYLKKFFTMLEFYIRKNITTSTFIFVNEFTYSGLTTSDWINDVIIIGSNEAINLICSQLINFYIGLNQNFKYSTFLLPATGLENGHIGLGYSTQQMCVNKYYFSDVMGYPLEVANIRRTSDLSLDVFSDSAFVLHRQHYLDSFKEV